MAKFWRAEVVCSARACSHTRNGAVAAQHTREVVSPQRADLVLAADVPDVEFGVLVRDRLDVEADGGDGRHVLVELELVEDCCARVSIEHCSAYEDAQELLRTGLSRCVQTQHQEAHLLGSEDLVHHLRYLPAHLVCCVLCALNACVRSFPSQFVLRGARRVLCRGVDSSASLDASAIGGRYAAE
jgi:hypothetical protein